MQLPAVQPTPTRCPTVSPLAARPTSTTRPTASCPSTAGNRENPQSLSRIDRSEWHSPQCSTATSTSSAPRGPRSIVSITIGLLASLATQAFTGSEAGAGVDTCRFCIPAGMAAVAVVMGTPFVSARYVLGLENGGQDQAIGMTASATPIRFVTTLTLPCVALE